MSEITLQSITTNRRTTQTPPFYVGAVAMTESGYLTPHLVTSHEELETIFGEDTLYLDSYKSFIDNDIPVCLLPLLSRESKYNRCSLRLSNGKIKASYPKYGKSYTARSISNIIRTDFVESDLDDTNSIKVTHNLKFYPKVLVETKNQYGVYVEIHPKMVYSDGSIKFTFDSRIGGSIIIEQLPDLDSSEDHIKILHFGKLGESGVTYSLDVDLKYPVIPEVVITKCNCTDGSITTHLGEKVDGNITLTSDNKLHINVGDEENNRYRVDIREIPPTMMSSRELIELDLRGDLVIPHDENRHPILKTTLNSQDVTLRVVYHSNSMVALDLEKSDESSYVSPNRLITRYNIIKSESAFDLTRLFSNQTMFNLILDFSEVPYSELIKHHANDYELGNYILIQTPTDTAIICSSKYSGVGTSYYNSYARIQTKIGIGEDDYTRKLSTISQLKDDWNTRYSNTCYDIVDLLIDFVTKFIKNNPLKRDQYKEYVDLDPWKQRFVEQSYIEDFWLATNHEVGVILESILGEVTSDMEFSDTWMIKMIKNLGLDTTTLLFEYASPIQDLNDYRLPGLSVRSDIWLTQDKLASFSEESKVVDFYSKIKGPAGNKIWIEIVEDRTYKGIYDLTISNDVIHENYTVHLVNHNYEVESIFLGDVSDKSALVEVFVFNYLDPKGKWIFDKFYNELDYIDKDGLPIPHDGDRVRDPKELVLPEGVYYLNRVTDEEYDLNSWKLSFDTFKTSDWYPDLFLVDHVYNDVEFLTLVEDLVEFKSDPNQSIFSQAVINLGTEQLNPEWYKLDSQGTRRLPGNNNRMLYCYGPIFIDDVEYPSYFPYVLNIIKQKYLDIPNDIKMYYDPFSLQEDNAVILKDDLSGRVVHVGVVEIVVSNKYIKLRVSHINESDEILYGVISDDYTKLSIVESFESDTVLETYTILSTVQFLDNNRINYLMYDNLRYYYKTLKEQLHQPNKFIVQFITSKYTREVYSIRHELTGISAVKLYNILTELNNGLLRKLPLVGSSKVDFKIKGDTANITFTVTIPSLINKEYKINFILNI